MRFLLDQDVYAITGRFLVALGHEVVTAAECGLSQAEDLDLLDFARKNARILVTRDRDFGGLVFVHKAGAGVLYLRGIPSTIDVLHNELETVLKLYREADLKKAFVVIEPHRHRFRKINA